MRDFRICILNPIERLPSDLRQRAENFRKTENKLVAAAEPGTIREM